MRVDKIGMRRSNAIQRNASYILFDLFTQLSCEFVKNAVVEYESLNSYDCVRRSTCNRNMFQVPRAYLELSHPELTFQMYRSSYLRYFKRIQNMKMKTNSSYLFNIQ